MRKDRPEQRREALKALIKHFVPAIYPTERSFGEYLGVLSGAHLTQMKNGHRAIGNELASRIEETLQLPMGAMDTGENVIDFFTPENQNLYPLSKRALHFAWMFDAADEADKNKVETYLTASLAVSGILAIPTRPQPSSGNTTPVLGERLQAKRPKQDETP